MADPQYVNVFVGSDFDGDSPLYVKIGERYLNEREMEHLASTLGTLLNSDERSKYLAEFSDEDDESGDDLCDTCMSSGVEVDHTHNGKTVCTKCAEGCERCAEGEEDSDDE